MPFLFRWLVTPFHALVLPMILIKPVLADESPTLQAYAMQTTIPFYHNGENIDFPFHWGSFVEEFSIDHATKPIVVAIHGTPGRWTHWGTLAKKTSLPEHFHLVSIDRPGWGDSIAPNVGVLPAFADQSQIIGQWLRIIRQATEQPIILLGHSWGGPIVARLMIDYPELADAGILVAAPMDPSLSQPRWYHRLANTKLAQCVIGNTLRNSNDEMLPLSQELAKMEQDLDKIHRPVAVLQGRKDRLVHWKNREFIERKMVNAALTVYDYPSVGHMIPFDTPEMISEAAFDIYQVLKDSVKTANTPALLAQ